MIPPFILTIGHDLAITANKWCGPVFSILQNDGIDNLATQYAPPAPEVHIPRVISQIAEFFFNHLIVASRTIHPSSLLVLMGITWDPVAQFNEQRRCQKGEFRNDQELFSWPR